MQNSGQNYSTHATAVVHRWLATLVEDTKMNLKYALQPLPTYRQARSRNLIWDSVFSDSPGRPMVRLPKQGAQNQPFPGGQWQYVQPYTV